MINKKDMLILEIEENENINNNVCKEDIINFLKNLKTMPQIDIETAYQDILNNKINLPSFELEDHYMGFCNYKDNKGNNTVIIKDTRGDNYFYIKEVEILNESYMNQEVYQCSIYEAQNIFFGEIAKEKKQEIDYVHDTLIDKLNCYQAIFFLPQSKYLSSLDDFIKDNIYMFNLALNLK